MKTVRKHARLCFSFLAVGGNNGAIRKRIQNNDAWPCAVLFREYPLIEKNSVTTFRRKLKGRKFCEKNSAERHLVIITFLVQLENSIIVVNVIPERNNNFIITSAIQTNKVKKRFIRFFLS